MDTSFSFPEMEMDFDSLDVLPTYNLSKHSSTERLKRLRELMTERDIQGYLIVDSDAHYTFYAQARQDRRINYITNSEVPLIYGVPGLTKGTMWSCDCRKRKSCF
jgi:hypothetical protein